MHLVPRLARVTAFISHDFLSARVGFLGGNERPRDACQTRAKSAKHVVRRASLYVIELG